MSVRYAKIQSLQQASAVENTANDEVLIEAVSSRGLAQLRLIGLPDNWLRESKEKIQSVVAHVRGWDALERVLVQIWPEDEVKLGAHLELPIALACLVALDFEKISPASLRLINTTKFVGALGLDGALRATPATRIFEQESAHVIGPSHYKSLANLWADLIVGQDLAKKSKELILPVEELENQNEHGEVAVHGREAERQWLMLAAAARLPLLFSGVPGVGKSHLARWAHSLCPLFWGNRMRKTKKYPLEAPHSRMALHHFLGTQRSGRLQAGLYARAHSGLLILDEFPEMNRDSREILRNILDHKKVKSMSQGRIHTWDSDFWLIATMNPCPCGYARPGNLHECRCLNSSLSAYSQKLSGPLFERFGIKLFLDRNAESPNLSPYLPSEIEHLTPEIIQRSPDQKLIGILAASMKIKHPNLSHRELLNKAKILEAFHRLSGLAPEKFESILESQIQKEANLCQFRPNFTSKYLEAL